MNVSPLSANYHNNVFEVTVDELSGLGYISWGDGDTVEVSANETSYNHTYKIPNRYNIQYFDCESVGVSVSSSVDVFLFTEPYINIETVSLEVTAGCKTEIILNSFNTDQYYTITPYSSGSDSFSYENPQTFWSHLKPQWRFLDDEDNVISQLEITGNPVYDGDYVVGYSSQNTIYYVDDMPGNPILFFTLDSIK